MKELWRKGKALWDDFSGIDAGTHASSIAYFTFLSLIPLLTLCISLVSLVGMDQSQVTEFFTALVPDAFNAFATTLVSDAFERSGIAFSLSTLTLLWSASKGIRALHSGLNAAYGVQETRSAFVVATISIVSAVILGLLLAGTMYLLFGGAVMRAIAQVIPDLAQQGSALNMLNSAAMAVLGVVALCACYTFLPAGTRRFRTHLPGAVLASLACGALTVGFHIYVDNFCNFDALYGNIATVALFLFWMYLVSYILLLGGFVNRYIAEKK